MAKKIDKEGTTQVQGTLYPPPYDEPCRKRSRMKLADAAGLTQFGVNLLRLEPGSWSSQRHWHTHEDEFVYVVDGEVVLVTNAGEEVFRAGDCAGFKANDPDGHHFQNRTTSVAVLLEIGSRIPGDVADYPDIDMIAEGSSSRRRDGTPYPPQQRKV